jgi:hypothetical protein
VTAFFGWTSSGLFCLDPLFGSLTPEFRVGLIPLVISIFARSPIGCVSQNHGAPVNRAAEYIASSSTAAFRLIVSEYAR